MTDDRITNRFSYDEIARLVAPGTHVLDLGCGSGDLLDLLRRTRGVTGRGVDIQEEMIRACLEKGISVFQGDLDEGLKEYRSQSYDYVILNETLQMIHDPVYLMNEMLRVGKRVIVNFPNFGYVVNRLQLAWLGQMPVNRTLPYEWYDTPNIHFCTRRDFVRLCDSIGAIIEAAVDLRRNRRVAGVFANFAATDCCFVLRKPESRV